MFRNIDERNVDISQHEHNMRILDNMEACYGCGACFNVCSTEAIDMRENEEGFLEPVIDGDKCIYGVWFSIIFA